MNDIKDKNQIQNEALNAIGNLKKTGVVVSMGVGKCLLGLKHMVKNYNDYASYLVVAPKKTIYNSWIDDAKKFDYEYLLNLITFSTYLSLDKLSIYDYDVIYLDKHLSITI